MLRMALKRITLVVFLGLQALAAAADSTPSTLGQEKRAALAAAIADYMERSGTPAVSVYVDLGGQPLYQAAFGVADLEHGAAARVDSVYAIGSITKTLTAHAVLQLAAEGKLDLDAPIKRYLTDYDGPGGAATARQLLVHTSGIVNYVSEVPGVAAQLRRAEMTRPAMVAMFEAAPLLFEPGTRWSYSNSGYYLLGLLIEKISGRTYYEYLRDSVLAPLGITRVYSGDDREVIVDRAMGYERGRDGMTRATPWHYLAPFAAGSLLSTAGELARYRRATFKSPQMNAEVTKLLTTRTSFADGRANQYLLGALLESDFEGQKKYAHSGEIWGYSSSHAYYPQRDLTVVVLTSTKAPLLTAVTIERKISRIALDLPARVTSERPVTEQSLQRYAGVYRLDPYRLSTDNVSFQVHDGRLLFQFGSGSDPARGLELVSQGAGRFRLRADDEWEFVFAGKDGDHASAVTLNMLNSSGAALYVPAPGKAK